MYLLSMAIPKKSLSKESSFERIVYEVVGLPVPSVWMLSLRELPFKSHVNEVR